MTDSSAAGAGSNGSRADLVSNPQLADAITKQIDDMLASVVDADSRFPAPDKGLAALAGVGPDAAREFGTTRFLWRGAYDETITSERINGGGDMYYLWQHEKIGVFRVVQKLQELFKAGNVRLSLGQARFLCTSLIVAMCCVIPELTALGVQAHLRLWRRTGSYGSRANTDFHKLFSHFVHQVTLFWRDKRISDVIRERAYDPSFAPSQSCGAPDWIWRNNLKWLSFGPSERAARGGDATARGVLQDPRFR